MRFSLASANSSIKRYLDSPASLAGIFLLAALYVAGAKFGFLLAFKAPQVTVVWPPTGIALAAALFFGPRVWPGIFLGAFIANFTSNEPIAVAFIIALGNTLEAVGGAWMMRRFAGFDPAIGRLQDVWALLLFAALAGAVISATIGVTSLCLGGLQPWRSWHFLWALWWIGDATSALIVTPLLLAWGQKSWHAWRGKWFEAFTLLAALIAACGVIFTRFDILNIDGHDFTYPIFPFIIWAAIRFGQRGTTIVTLIASGIAIWATFHDVGPFAGGSTDQSLAMLQTFIAIVAVTGLFLSAAITERRKSEIALQEANRNKDEFLSTLAHELRNPLAPVSNAVYMLQQSSITPDRRSQLFALIERQLQQIIRLVEDLVDASRISRGKIELRKEPMTLTEAINLALETTQGLIDEYKHKLSIDLGETPLWLNADLARIAQIFTNLLNNAAKYTPAGGNIQLEARREGNEALIEVRDTGIGISDTVLPHIFDMFMQAEDSQNSHGGLGIGLTLVKRLVEMHDGVITASSAGRGKGSLFSVRLPLVAPPVVNVRPAPVEVPESAHRTYRILLADDNESFAETFGHMLSLCGHSVQIVHNGPDAIALAQSFVPEVVLLDIGLPDINGCDVCRQLRTMPALKSCIIIAQTGYSQSEHRERSKAAGFDYHLIKPIRIEVVEEILRSPGSTSVADRAA